MFGKKVILVAASILALSLWGCSADFDTENNQTSGGAGTAVVDNSSVGAGNCIGCHEVLDFDKGTTVIADYLAGKHVIHKPYITAADSDCLKCHDPLGDGRSLETYIESGGKYDPWLADNTVVEADYLPANGLAAVTCETCHGAGGDHVNGAAIPYRTPDYNRCGQCHNSDFFHRDHGHTAEEDNIVEDYTSSKHFSGAIRTSLACVKCHSDEGARLYKDIDALSVLTLADALPVAESNSIQCRTCHDPHNNGKLLKPDTLNDPDPSLRASAEYNTCTNCHQRHDAQIIVGDPILQITGTATLDGSNGDLIFHAGSWDRVISSTHWDDPATSYQQIVADAIAAGGTDDDAIQANNLVEGYAIDPMNERACRDCHNVHGADATINKQWASSAHGSHIREAKETAAALTYGSTIEQVAAVRNAGANGADNALPHYNWDNSTGNPRDDDDPDRKSCQKCHTATGAKNYLESLIVLNEDPDNYIEYDPANNDFSHLDGWTVNKTSGQNELIYCWACHADNSGVLRNPGRVPLDLTVSTVPVVLPDLGKSNVCATCHGGRGNNDSIRADRRSSRFAGHHAPVAGVLLSGDTHLGYEYNDINGAPLDYTNVSYFKHSRIGTDVSGDADAASFAGAIAIVGTDKGPCVSCHMPETNHTYEVVEKDPVLPVLDVNGAPVIDAHGNPLMKVTAINHQKLCNTCHSTHGLMTPAVIDEQSAGYQNAGALLVAYVGNTITNYLGHDMNVEWDHDSDPVTDPVAYYSTDPIEAYGAFQNAMFTADEPGGFAHNRYYVKRLIFDSIDWLNNGVLDSTIPINADIYPEAAKWLDKNYKSYLPDPTGLINATRP